MKIIREPQVLIGMLEEGELAESMKRELAETLTALSDAAGPKGKATGHVSLKLNLKVEAGMVTISADLASKRPKEERRASIYWVTEDGALSTQHPRQTDMFDGPREVSTADAG
ncbi:hypothetical protein [Notoacmeibacter sp. MSK16QG-6]|uniref:hypothetical protein n=1 Tax=Notoacmeibacter sp. MSK16QG-6 TaxID=2957982 RepID=UPI0020A1ADAA|nr:hypothetical protein [Notoacmeibacter sp. MSK16QG-6]MCP1200090.1 hypothetical protein [Notoacmeibacter sp. MSK16QG-6]